MKEAEKNKRFTSDLIKEAEEEAEKEREEDKENT